jgi:ankyrin repeat protein
LTSVIPDRAVKDTRTAISHTPSDIGYFEIAKLLYEHGVAANIHKLIQDGWLPLYAASSGGHLEVVKFLYEHGAHIILSLILHVMNMGYGARDGITIFH